MKITAWRITTRRYAESACSGAGARLEGGRWNRKGVPIVYTAESLALGALEIIVHLPDEALLYTEYVRIPVTFDSRNVNRLTLDDLPSDWNSHPPSESTQKIGTDWAQENRSLIMQVPSSVIPEESNYLINPSHPLFGSLEIGDSAPFRFDPRFLKKKDYGLR